MVIDCTDARGRGEREETRHASGGQNPRACEPSAVWVGLPRESSPESSPESRERDRAGRAVETSSMAPDRVFPTLKLKLNPPETGTR